MPTHETAPLFLYNLIKIETYSFHIMWVIQESVKDQPDEISDSNPYSGVELQPWTFQWDLTL